MAITLNGKAGITNITELTVGSSADLAGIISDESGTGVLVFNNTPSLTTPALSGAVLSGTLTAGGGVGTAGQVLTSTGTGVEYTTPSAGTTANDQAFAFAVQVFA